MDYWIFYNHFLLSASYFTFQLAKDFCDKFVMWWHRAYLYKSVGFVGISSFIRKSYSPLLDYGFNMV